jgi:FeS assembly SUF system protein
MAEMTDEAATVGVDETKSGETGVEAGASAPSVAAVPLSPEDLDRLTDDIIAGLKTVYDPEIPADIYELGLIYRIDISDDRFITIDMTLTAPGCPVAGEMPGWVETAVLGVPGVSGCRVVMTFDPPWDQSRMSDEARVALDMW